ncbi:MAG: methyltransferase domain-containing protein, partial [Candidatus Latescibacteria bacterium]|nr:methyltransferase domain-containing protein [Candidatus Latescibacterota bacterium]
MGHFRRSLERRRFEFIARLVPRRGVSRVLDVGCGSGWLSEMLADRGFRVASLDIGLDRLRRASKR